MLCWEGGGSFFPALAIGSHDAAAAAGLITLECSYMWDTQPSMRKGENRGLACGLLQGRKSMVLVRKPAVQQSRGQLWKVGKSMAEKNITRRQRLFHFLIESEFNIYSIQTNTNLEGLWRKC